MSHARTQIRKKAAELLAPVAPVHCTRVLPIEQASLPVLLVSTATEEIEGQFGVLDRRLELIVEAVTATQPVDDALDALIVEIESALTGDLEGLVASCNPASIEVSASDEGNTLMGRARVIFSVVYRTAYADPETSV